MEEEEGHTTEVYMYLHDAGVGEGVLEEVHMVPQLQHVYEVVMVPCGHLHQTEEPLERAVGVVLWWEGRGEGVIV